MTDVREAALGGRGPHDELSRARRKVAALKGLYLHGSIYAVVLVGLFIVNWLSGEAWWVQWVVIGWGIGVGCHVVAVYFDVSNRVAEWEHRKVEELLQTQPPPR